MNPNKLKQLAVAVSLSLWASQSAASSILVTGELEAVAPQVTFTNEESPLAYVSPFEIDATEAANSGCTLTGDPSLAKADNGEELVCLFEWNEIPSGMVAQGMKVSGYLPNTGNNQFPYSISYYSGSQLEKVEISNGVVDVVAQVPPAPTLSQITTTLADRVEEGLSVVNYSKVNGLTSVTAFVDDQKYQQIVNIKDIGACVVAVGEDSCTIAGNGRSIGDDNVTGEISYEIAVDSDNGYFSSNDLDFAEDYTVAWDYRPPTLVDLKMKALSESNSESEAFEVEGVSFVVENEQAKLIVDTPHFGKPGDWWVPTAKLELTPDPSFSPSIPVFELDGRNVVDLAELVGQSQKNFVLNPISNPVVSNGKYIFTFDLHSVADGVFIPNVTVSDFYGNKEVTQQPAVIMDRQPPEVQVLYNGEKFLNEEEVYFFEDMYVIALDTFDGGAEIVSVKVGGQDLGLEGDSFFAKKLKAAELLLTPQMEYRMEVTVKDEAGNVHTESILVNYMPMDYELEYADETYYKTIQRLNLDINKLKGVMCPLYASEAEMSETAFMYGENQRCYIEWTNLPTGSTGLYANGQVSLTGNLLTNSSEAVNEVGYRVWMLNSSGTLALAAEESDILTVEDAPAPELIISQKTALTENLFPVQLTGKRFTTAYAKGVNADLELESENETEVVLTQAGQRNGNYTATSAYQTLRVDEGKLWDRRTFEVSASYTLDSSINSKQTLETVYVPSSRIRSRISTEELTTLDTETPSVTMKLGIYDTSSKDFVYEPSEQGEWNVYLAQQVRDPETHETSYQAITEAKKYTGDNDQFELDVSDVGYGSYRFMAVADLVSPVEGYSRQVVSNTAFFKVLKGGALDGNVKTYRMAAPVPFTASFQYESENREDRQALGTIRWEMSQGGVDDWVAMDKYQDQVRMRISVEKADHYFVRATVTNELSGEVTVTDVVEVLGYETPDLDIIGVNALYEGEAGVLTLEDRDELADSLKGVIEWSLDGETWEEGTNTLNIVGTGNRMKIWSRMAYHNNELAGNSRYDKVQHQISVKKTKPVTISLREPRLVEVGVPFTLTPSVRLATSQLKSETYTQWVLSDGTIVAGNELTYTPTDADAENSHTDFKFQAWVVGLKDETFAEKDVSISTWKYTFPEFSLKLNYRTRYAPVTATAIVRKLDYPRGNVDFTYDFEMFEGMVQNRNTGERLYFTANEVGVHEVRVNIKDDRGNEKEMMTMLEVLPPPDTVIEISANYSTPYMRYPLDASIRTRVELGHPNDRIDKYEWYLDGELIPDEESSRVTVEDLGEGNHQVVVRVTSEFGIAKEERLDIQVAPNVPGECDMSYRQYGSSINVKSGCEDPDGRMSTFNWYVDGELIHVHANNVSVISKPGEAIDFRVVGFDDSGASTEASLSVMPE